MKRNWFYRMLLSYLPAFVVMIILLVAMAFFQLNQLSRHEAERANRAFLTYVNQSLDSALAGVDRQIVGFLTSASVNEYYYSGLTTDERWVAYNVSKEMYRLVGQTDLIDSMYLYRKRDDAVLSNEMLLRKDQFGDSGFIDEMLEATYANYYWSGVRSYRALPNQAQPEKVVSLVRKVPLLTGTHGLLVMNIRTDSLEAFISNIFGGNESYYIIRDTEGRLLAANVADESSGRTRFSALRSDYNRWSYESGIVGERTPAIVPMASYAWFAMLLVIAALGIGWIVYSTRRNYKPLEAIIGKIQYYSERPREMMNGKTDEFHFIQSALEELVRQTNDYRKQHSDGLAHRRRNFFFDMLYGTAGGKDEAWAAEAEAAGLRPPFEGLQALVMEIDRHREFEAKYTTTDQSLLKFVLSSVVKETAAGREMPAWREWIGPAQLAVVLQAPAPGGEEREGAEDGADFCDAIRAWVDKNLDFSVTIGVGTLAKTVEHLPESLDAALDMLKYKSVLGRNNVIHSVEVGQLSKSDLYHSVRLVRVLVQTIRMGDEGWEREYDALFAEISAGVLNRDEIKSLMQYLMFQIYKDLAHLPDEFKERWSAEWSAAAERMLQQYELLDELRDGMRALLGDVFLAVRRHLHSHSRGETMMQVKAYLEEHYADPNLSLTHLSDRFGIKYVSQLFKEELGENFSDYLARIRIGHAQERLVTTDETVQEIAKRVGYLHSFSFIRLFKRLTGMTPGDYRKMHRC